MEKRDSLYLRHMSDAVDKVRSFAGGVDFERFKSDEMLHGAVIHQLLIIGEAANKISDSFRDARPDWPWRGMISMRNKLIHDYFRVSLEEVWKTVVEDLPGIRTLLDLDV